MEEVSPWSHETVSQSNTLTPAGGTPELNPLPPTRVRHAVVAAACSLAFVAYVHRSGFAYAGKDLKGELGLSDDDWGTIMAAFLVAYGLFEIPWGIIGDRFGARHLIAVSALGWSVLTACTGLAGWMGSVSEQVLLLLGLRFLFGAFQAGAFPAISRLMADWMPLKERATAQGIVWMSSRIGGAVAPHLMVPLILWSNWEGSLAIVAVLGFGWCAAFWPWLRNRPEQMRRVNPSELSLIAAGRTVRAASHMRVPWRRFLGSANIWALCFMYGCGGFTASFFITLLPDYLKTHRMLSEEEAKWLSSVPLACGIVACVAGGLFSDWIVRRTGHRKWGRRWHGVAGYGCAGLAILSTIWVRDVWALCALLSAAFFFFDLTMGPAWAACADIGERHAGTLGGAMNMIGNFGAAAGAKMAGYLFGKDLGWILGNDLVFVLFACSFGLGALCWLRVDVTEPLGEG